MSTEFSEYHHIVATIIQRKWKRYNIQKRLWCMIKPDDPFSLKVKKTENDFLIKYFKRIHAQTTHFRTIIVKYNSADLIKTVEINYESDNNYTIYDINSNEYAKMNTNEITSELNNIQNIISIKMQGIVSDLNFYGYPDLVQIKCY